MALKPVTGKYKCERVYVTELVGTCEVSVDGKSPSRVVKGEIGLNWGPGRGVEYIITTKANSWVVFNVFDVAKVWGMSGSSKNDFNFLKLGSNSKLKVTVSKGRTVTDWDGDDKTFELISGSLQQDKEAAAIQSAKEAVRVLVTTLSKQGVRAIVDTCRSKASNNNDTLANLAIAAATTEAAITSFVLGLGGPVLAIPAGASDMVAQWIYQAQVAYALGYVYKRYPGKDSSFENDLLILLAGDDALKDALKDDLESLKKDTKNPLKNGLADLGCSYLEKKPELVTKIISKALEKLGAKFASKVGQVVNGVLSWVPFGMSVYGVTSSGWNAATFSVAAKRHYSK